MNAYKFCQQQREQEVARRNRLLLCAFISSITLHGLLAGATLLVPQSFEDDSVEAPIELIIVDEPEVSPPEPSPEPVVDEPEVSPPEPVVTQSAPAVEAPLSVEAPPQESSPVRPLESKSILEPEPKNTFHEPSALPSPEALPPIATSQPTPTPPGIATALGNSPSTAVPSSEEQSVQTPPKPLTSERSRLATPPTPPGIATALGNSPSTAVPSAEVRPSQPGSPGAVTRSRSRPGNPSNLRGTGEVIARLRQGLGASQGKQSAGNQSGTNPGQNSSNSGAIAARSKPTKPSPIAQPDEVPIGSAAGCQLGKQPKYPTSLASRGIEARPVLEIQTDANGRATSHKVIKSSGYAELDEAALKAAPSLTCPFQAPRRVRIAISFVQEGSKLEQEARQRQAEKQRQAEFQRQAELQRQAEAEKQRQAELQRQAEAEEQRQAELQRQAEAEKQRQAELQRQAEAEKQRQAEAEIERQQLEVERQLPVEGSEQLPQPELEDKPSIP
jgi:TonB family protein